MNYKNLLITSFASAMLLASASSVAAAGSSNCQVIYGGGEVCQEKVNFTIDKKVMQPTKGGSFVDNLTMNDARYQAGSQVTFQIVVTNTGNKTIETLNVTDTLPSQLSFVSGPGSFNKDTKTISYTVKNLEAGKSHTQTFVTAVANSETLPQNQVTCITNTASGNDTNGITASDTSSLCAENPTTTTSTGKPTPKVFESTPVKKVPETGPEMLSLLSLIPAGIAGYALRKKSKLN